MEIKKVNLQNTFTKFNDYWNPRIIGDLNGQQVKAAKLKGEFVFHHHDNEDEMFLVISGNMQMVLEDKTLDIGPGEFIIIPKGVSHKPIAEEEVHLLLFEPAATLHTGNVRHELTKDDLERL
jgi:mannose-6-phosphate isomerase-like protein (cupin superfamily)